MAMIKCPQCGRDISDQGQLCPFCMTPMQEIRALRSVPVTQKPEKKKRGCLGCLIGVLAAFGVLMIILIIGTIFLSGEDDKKEQKSYTEDTYSSAEDQPENSVSISGEKIESVQNNAPLDEGDGKWAKDFTPINEFRYQLDKSANTITLIQYEGNRSKIMVSPTYTIDGTDYKVVSMGDRGCFFGEISISSIYIPEGVTSMSANCFNSCASLEHLYIPSTMGEIPDGFWGYFNDGYEVYCSAAAALPQDRDTNEYSERTDTVTQAEDLGRGVGGAVNGLMSGLFSDPDDPIIVQVYFGGSEEQWKSIQ